MHSLTRCCAHEGARQGITPYQRLPRSRSASSHPDIVPNAHTHRPFHDDLQPNRRKSDPFSHTSSSQSSRFEHNLQTEKCCSASNCLNLHSHGDLRTTICSNDEAAIPALSIVPSSSRQSHHFDSIPGCIGNAYTFVNIYNASQFQHGKSLIEPEYEDVNTVLVKVGIIGDSGTGKTSFMGKYGGVEVKNDVKDVALLRKLCKLQHVNIALHIWDLGGQWQYSTKMPTVCKDAATIFIMFDLTRRSTLQSVKKWYLCARELNKVATIVLIGTKYDGFVHMSKELQLAIIQEARIHSKKMKASLFFSSVTYNINVHKVFKVVVAKLFDLPCRITQNFKFGEPIVSFQ